MTLNAKRSAAPRLNTPNQETSTSAKREGVRERKQQRERLLEQQKEIVTMLGKMTGDEKKMYLDVISRDEGSAEMLLDSLEGMPESAEIEDLKTIIHAAIMRTEEIRAVMAEDMNRSGSIPPAALTDGSDVDPKDMSPM